MARVKLGISIEEQVRRMRKASEAKAAEQRKKDPTEKERQHLREMAWSHRAMAAWYAMSAVEDTDPMARPIHAANAKEFAQKAAEAEAGLAALSQPQPEAVKPATGRTRAVRASAMEAAR